MSNMSICGCCGRTTDKSFPFCPWCGNSKVSKTTDESAAEIFQENNRDKKLMERMNQMEEIGQRIDDLERELSVLVLSAEMHK